MLTFAAVAGGGGHWGRSTPLAIRPPRYLPSCIRRSENGLGNVTSAPFVPEMTQNLRMS